MTQDNKEQAFAVLFVDDEEKARKYFRMAYVNDFPVLTASSVPEALDILGQRGDDISVLITDQRMPGQQGVDLLKRTRDEWPAIVRILTTAYSDLDDAIAAVNRGEILRYVTKPWDIQELRIDLLHAREFFFLRREHGLLLAEKFNVRQRMIQSDRLVGLLTITAGLERLRHAPYGAAAWARDAHASISGRVPPVAELELWGLEVKETLNLMHTHRSLRALDQSVESGFPDKEDIAQLLLDQGLVIDGHAGTVSSRHDLIASLIATLAELAGHPASAHCEWDSTEGANAALTIRVLGPGATSSPFFGDLQENSPDIRLLGAYLIAWHHGGALKATTTDGQIQFLLTLPKEPGDVVLPDLDEESLAALFSMLEDWQ